MVHSTENNIAPDKNLRSLGKYASFFFCELGINIFNWVSQYITFVSLRISKLSIGYPCKLISLR